MPNRRDLRAFGSLAASASTRSASPAKTHRSCHTNPYACTLGRKLQVGAFHRDDEATMALRTRILLLFLSRPIITHIPSFIPSSAATSSLYQHHHLIHPFTSTVPSPARCLRLWPAVKRTSRRSRAFMWTWMNSRIMASTQQTSASSRALACTPSA